MTRQPEKTPDYETIRKFLKALPHLELSDKGLKNVAKKFGTTVKVITSVIKEEDSKNQ